MDLLKAHLYEFTNTQIYFKISFVLKQPFVIYIFLPLQLCQFLTHHWNSEC